MDKPPPKIDLAPFDAAPPEVDRDALFAQVERDIASEGLRGRMRAIPTPLRLGLGAVLAGAIALLSFVVTGRPDVAVYPDGRLALELLAIGGLNFGLLALTTRPGFKPEFDRTTFMSLIGVALLAPFVLGLLPVAHTAHEASLAGAGADFWPRALGCLAFGIGAGAPMLLVLAAIDRQSLSWSARIALGGSAAGLTGLLALQLHCPITHSAHILTGHAPVVAGCVAGWFLLKRSQAASQGRLVL